jgi:hypothetical protein
MVPSHGPLNLLIQDDLLAVCRLDRSDAIPAWATRGDYFSITRTNDELSIVCQETSVPEEVRSEGGWRALQVAGAIDFSVVGVLATLAVPLAEAGISLLAVSTFDTDYLLVKEQDLDRTVDVLKRSGHSLR